MVTTSQGVTPTYQEKQQSESQASRPVKTVDALLDSFFEWVRITPVKERFNKGNNEVTQAGGANFPYESWEATARNVLTRLVLELDTNCRLPDVNKLRQELEEVKSKSCLIIDGEVKPGKSYVVKGPDNITLAEQEALLRRLRTAHPRCDFVILGGDVEAPVEIKEGHHYLIKVHTPNAAQQLESILVTFRDRFPRSTFAVVAAGVEVVDAK